MATFEALDPRDPIQGQLSNDTEGEVVLVNLFTVDAEDVDAMLAAWEHDANWMRRQPGYVSTQLHRTVGDGNAFLNYAVWESVAHFRAAFSHPDFRRALADYPESVVIRPHLFSRLAVPNLCAA